MTPCWYPTSVRFGVGQSQRNTDRNEGRQRCQLAIERLLHKRSPASPTNYAFDPFDSRAGATRPLSPAGARMQDRQAGFVQHCTRQKHECQQTGSTKRKIDPLKDGKKKLYRC